MGELKTDKVDMGFKVAMGTISIEEQKRICNLLGDALLKAGINSGSTEAAEAVVLGFLTSERLELSTDNFERWVAGVRRRVDEMKLDIAPMFK